MLNKLYTSKKHNLSREFLFHLIEKNDVRAYSLIPNTGKGIPVSFGEESSGLYFYIPKSTIDDFFQGDMFLAHPRGSMRNIFSARSNDNTLFLTGQCNNHCLMCSQPPIRKKDVDFYLALNTLVLRHMPSDTAHLGITGGEPTLLGEKLVTLLEMAYERNPAICLHLLSNGRAFSNKKYASLFTPYARKDMIICIPMHSDYPGDHNIIAGNQDAYVQTLSGLYNLARNNIAVEIRIVINKLNYKRLPRMATFIFRNFPFVKHVAFMGMEYHGLILKNYALMGIDPVEYCGELESAVLELSDWGMQTSIYNIPLCLLTSRMRPFAQRSISDWKETYPEICTNCRSKEKCCGIFSTSRVQSTNISPL